VEGARVTALSNGDDLDFQQERPVLRTDEPLVVELNRPLDPDRALLRLMYVPPPVSGGPTEPIPGARAVFELERRTDRVVIPASALAEVASHVPEAVNGPYLLRISEYLLKEDVYEIVRAPDGTTESLSGLQVNHFSIYVRMNR
jgi:hypothetical protein